MATAETKTLKKSGKSPQRQVEDTSKKAITQKVIVNRDLMYIYPQGMTDTLERKAFRQKVRNAIRKMERDLKKVSGKELKELQIKFAAYKKEVMV